MIETEFKTELLMITPDLLLVNDLWLEIHSAYGSAGRHYHTLQHLNSLVLELFPLQEKIEDWSTLVFSIVYHDIIYNPLKHNNEERSAELAVERLAMLGLSELKINRCKEQILATANHVQSADNDTNYFTDADLAILGADPDTYKKYSQAIRKEYNVYPDLVYNPGRQKVLTHFLQMPKIYKTAYFENKYEITARQNISTELKSLL